MVHHGVADMKVMDQPDLPRPEGSGCVQQSGPHWTVLEKIPASGGACLLRERSPRQARRMGTGGGDEQKLLGGLVNKGLYATALRVLGCPFDAVLYSL
jgi:hypothetical protein